MRNLRVYFYSVRDKDQIQKNFNVTKIEDELDQSSEKLESTVNRQHTQSSVTWNDVTTEEDRENLYPNEKLLTLEEVAELMGETVNCIEDHILKGNLIALGKGGRQGNLLPAEQFQNGRPVDGLADVLTMVKSPTLA